MHGLRLCLALLVMWGHAHYMVRLRPDSIVLGIGPGTFAVWTFFFLSGFLVTHSWLRQGNASRFVVHRVARIVPGLIVAVLLSSLVAAMTSRAGPLASVTRGGWGTIRYILHDTIPGSYVGTRYHGVLNGSLWSLRWEIEAYLFVLVAGVSGALGKVGRSNLLLLVILALLLVNLGHVLLFHGSHATFSVSCIFAEFVLGMLLAVNLARVRSSHVILVAGIMAGIIWFFSGIMSVYAPLRQLVILLPPALLVCLVSIFPVWRLPDLRQDLSYGVYVYAWPVEQWINWRLPGLTSLDIVLAATPVILVLATVSWTFLEAPALEWAKKYRGLSPAAPAAASD
ncbi:MAG: acyltransferase family protein [Acidiferrobacteraceae bacterium]